jgi:anti-anti-sigma factor
MGTVERRGTVLVIRPDRPLQGTTIDEIRERVDSMLSHGTPLIVVDLAETPLFDGSGLEWILDLDERCATLGGCLRVCHVNELCRDIFRMTGVGETLIAYDDLTTALGSFA